MADINVPYFVLGHALARKVASPQKRITSGLLMGLSPTPFGVAATLTMIRSSSGSKQASSQPTSSQVTGSTTSTGSGQRRRPPPTPDDLMTDAKEMFDAVTNAAGKIGRAADKFSGTRNRPTSGGSKPKQQSPQVASTGK